MRVAIVHDWLTGMRGGERVLEELLQIWPDAELFVLLHRPGSVSRAIEGRPIHTSFIQRVPGATRWYRYCLPLFPAAAEALDLTGFDLVVSSSHCVAKGVLPPVGAPHLCYCHTPMRYVWDAYTDYFGPGRAPWWVRRVAPPVARRLRRWDRGTAHRVDRFVANSRHVGDRIRRFYGRKAGVVHPPVQLERFSPGPTREDLYLVVSALVPYKRVDLAVEAFNRMGRRLLVVGDGPEYRRLRRLAGPTVELAGRATDQEVADLMARCRAFVMPQEEDFGITAVEAQASGAPVIAYGRGGALETVRGGPAAPTGVFFSPQTPEALVRAVAGREARSFREEDAVANARRFSPEAFRAGIRRELEALLRTFRPEGRVHVR